MRHGTFVLTLWHMHAKAKQPVSEWDSKKIPCAVSYPTMEKHGLLFVWPQVRASN